MAGTVQDVTEMKSLEKRLEMLSTTDDLTGLHNRRGFFAFGDRVLKIARREGKGLYLLYADLDGLKEINDRFGHNEGDQALQGFATTLARTYRETDIIARIGGDEFAVIPVGAPGDNIDDISRRLHDRIAEYNSTSEHHYNLSASTGVAYYDPGSPVSMDELLAAGDKAMYESKSMKKKGH